LTHALHQFATGLVVLLGLSGTAGAADFAASQALQNHGAWMRHDATLRDCEASYRSFRSRTTLSPSRRRAERERCRRKAAGELAVEPSPTSSGREVALGD
jgi:hypothetical protein